MIFKKIRKLQLGGAIGQYSPMGLKSTEFQVLDTSAGKGSSSGYGSAGKASSTKDQTFKKGLQSDRTILNAKIAKQKGILNSGSNDEDVKATPEYKAAAMELQRLSTVEYGNVIAREEKYKQDLASAVKSGLVDELAMSNGYALVSDGKTTSVVPVNEALTAKLKDSEGNIMPKYRIESVKKALSLRSIDPRFAYSTGGAMLEDIIGDVYDTEKLSKTFKTSLESVGFSSGEDDTAVTVGGQTIDVNTLFSNIDNIAGKATVMSESNSDNLHYVMDLLDSTLSPKAREAVKNRASAKVAENTAYRQVSKEEFDSLVVDEVSRVKAGYIRSFMQTKYKKKLSSGKKSGSKDTSPKITLTSLSNSLVYKGGEPMNVEIYSGDKEKVEETLATGDFGEGMTLYKRDIQKTTAGITGTTDRDLQRKSYSISNSNLLKEVSSNINDITIGTSGKKLSEIVGSDTDLFDSTTLIGSTMKTVTLPVKSGTNTPDWAMLDALKKMATFVNERRKVVSEAIAGKGSDEKGKKAAKERFKKEVEEKRKTLGIENVKQKDFMVAQAAMPNNDFEDPKFQERFSIKANITDFNGYVKHMYNSDESNVDDMEDLSVVNLFIPLKSDANLAFVDFGMSSITNTVDDWNAARKASVIQNYDITSDIATLVDSTEINNRSLKKYGKQDGTN